jgi:hypothetical protein
MNRAFCYHRIRLLNFFFQELPIVLLFRQ